MALAHVSAMQSQINTHEHPAYAVWLQAYSARLDAVLCASRSGPDGLLQLEAAWPTLGDELVELGKLCFDEPTDHDAEITNFLAAELNKAGFKFTQVQYILDEAGARSDGRPRTSRSIEALEMHLTEKSYRDIANHQDPRQPGDDDEVRKDRIRKRVGEMLPLYNKYLPRK